MVAFAPFANPQSRNYPILDTFLTLKTMEHPVSDFNPAKNAFLQSIDGDQHLFADTLAFIVRWFDFSPSAFRNGHVSNSSEQNQGSCKVFAMASLLDLDAQQALRCFGEHYRDVLATPDADNHHNLRRVLAQGLSGIEFDHFPLQFKRQDN